MDRRGEGIRNRLIACLAVALMAVGTSAEAGRWKARAAVAEFGVEVPGTYTLVDHAIFRVEKGAAGYLQVEGEPRHDRSLSKDDAALCKGCLVHP